MAIRIGLGIAAFSVAVFTLPTALRAQSGGAFLSGNDLYSRCTAVGGSPDLGFCYGYIEAVADTMTKNQVNGFTACFPNGVTAGQLKDMVISSLAKNVNERHFIAHGLVASAFETAFPCGKPNSNTNPFR